MQELNNHVVHSVPPTPEVSLLRTKMIREACLLILIAYLPLFAETAADSSKPTVVAAKIEGDLALSGKLSDPRWDLARPVQINFEVSPGENIQASQQTMVRILYNSEYVYFGFDCRDTNASAIRAHITDRDKIFDDDFVGLILDTYGDYQHAYGSWSTLTEYKLISCGLGTMKTQASTRFGRQLLPPTTRVGRPRSQFPSRACDFQQCLSRIGSSCSSGISHV